MLTNNRKLLLLLLLIFSLSIAAFAQQKPAAPAEGFKLFFEKVYLHLDRTYYASGDDIWFKAYLVNGQSNEPVNTSNNLYVDLINPASKIVSSKLIRLNNGIGAGDFKLEDSVAGGTYRVRAYTNWMRNFGTHFVFEKEIQVANIPGVSKSSAADAKMKSDKSSTTTPGYKIQFLPEGGTLVEGIQTVVAFKAEDANGRGVEARGDIVSSRGGRVASFKTTYNGMGNFTFKPVAGIQYTASVHYRSSSAVEAAFPVALKDGFVMSVLTDTANIVVNITANGAAIASHPTGEMNIAARRAGKSYFKEKVMLKNGIAAVTIPKKDFPTGIANITLYDEIMHPYCERLVYIENNIPLNVTVSPDKASYQPKEKVTVNISVTDAQQHPIKTVLSFAAVEDGLDKQPTSNILSNLLLESEVAGKVENAAAYFDKNNSQRFQQLDLLLQTQGWRSFLWRQIADTTIKISYLPEPGITISGMVTKPSTKKVLPGMNITLFAPDAKGDKIYMTKTNAQGKYYLDGLPLYGLQTIKLNTGDGGVGKTVGAIKMDPLISNPLPVTTNPVYTIDTSAFMNSFAKEAAKRSSMFKNPQWYNMLPGVTVKTNRGTTILRDGSAAVNFGYPAYDFNITEKDYEYQRLRDFIVQKIPGAMYDEEMEGVNFLEKGKRVRPILIVNKQEDIFGRLDYYSLPMEQVDQVSVRHLVGSPVYESGVADESVEEGLSNTSNRGIRDFYLVNIKVKPGNYDQQLSKINADVTGYYEGRIFYSPNYSKDDTTKEDNRITIHWSPYITTNENGKATITFYNADPKSTIRLDVQGVTNNGIPVVANANYTVK